jgi:hypothetical protein
MSIKGDIMYQSVTCASSHALLQPSGDFFMTKKTVLALALTLLLSGNALAQSGPREQASNFFAQITQWFESIRAQQNRPAQPARPVRSVPELDGSMAVMALGLTLAVGGLIREKRRPR